MIDGLAPADRVPNPALLSGELAALFPVGVVAAELDRPAPEELLTPEERESIRHCAAKRIRDFTAGRLCAHRALQEFGIYDFSLLSAPDRQPIWPPSLLGSITHTDGFSAAVIGRRGEVRSLGLDSEVISAVHEEVWRRVCTEGEIHRLETLPPESRTAGAALIFAAKEAFYKCQFPLTREWIGFEDVSIEWEGAELREGAFLVQPHRPLRLQEQVRTPMNGRFRFHGPFVTTAMAVLG